MKHNPITWKKNEYGRWQKRNYGVQKVKNLIASITLLKASVILTVISVGILVVIPWLSVSGDMTVARALGIDAAIFLVVALGLACVHDARKPKRR